MYLDVRAGIRSHEVGSVSHVLLLEQSLYKGLCARAFVFAFNQ